MTPQTPAPLQQRVDYLIIVQGTLDVDWADYFGQMELLPREDGTTVIRGPCPDQAALHGLLARVRDLGLTLLRVERISTEQ